MNRTEQFQCTNVYGHRLRRRRRAVSMHEEKVVFVGLGFFRCIQGHQPGGTGDRRLMEEKISFVIGLQRLMAYSHSDLETALVGMMNNSTRYGDNFIGYAGLISEYIFRGVSALQPEDCGLAIWVELDKVIEYSRDREEEEVETVRYDGSGAEEEEEVCPVCLKSLVVGEEIKRTPCGHLFHGECIFRWLERSRTCPMCRFDMHASVHL